MAAPWRQLDATHARVACESLRNAQAYLAATTKSLETGVPCAEGDPLRLILTYVDCAANLLQESIDLLAHWPGVPLLDRDRKECKEFPR